MTAAVSAAGGVPVVLLVGRCIEVWADPGAERPPSSAMRRFSVVWSWWLEGAGVDSRERCQIIPTGNPWSAAYLVGTGRSPIGWPEPASRSTTCRSLPSRPRSYTTERQSLGRIAT